MGLNFAVCPYVWVLSHVPWKGFKFNVRDGQVAIRDVHVGTLELVPYVEREAGRDLIFSSRQSRHSPCHIPRYNEMIVMNIFMLNL